MNNIVYNKAWERLEAHFPNGNLIPVKDAADYLGVDHRTLEARKDFPVIRLPCRGGSKGMISKERLAYWLANAEG